MCYVSPMVLEAPGIPLPILQEVHLKSMNPAEKKFFNQKFGSCIGLHIFFFFFFGLHIFL